MVQVVKNPPANAGHVRDVGSIPGCGGVGGSQEDPLEKEMATRSSIPAWRIRWTEEPGGLQSTVLHRVGHDWSELAHMHAFFIKEKYLKQTEIHQHIRFITYCIVLFKFL